MTKASEQQWAVFAMPTGPITLTYGPVKGDMLKEIRDHLREKAATARQLEFLEYMRSYADEHGMPPTLREIADAMGVASTNAVSDVMKALERKGLVRHSSKRSRGWRPR